MIDALTRSLSDPFEGYHMGVTADNVARECGISRQAQDELAVESHRRASRAVADGRFREQIVGVPVRTRQGPALFDIDEHVRGDAQLDDLQRLKPVFEDEGSVTAGNSSGSTMARRR